MKQRGFTLVEVLVAALIVMLGVTGYVTLQSVYMRGDATANLRAQAQRLAEEKIEDLRGFTQISAQPGQFAFVNIGNNVGGNLPAGNVNVQLTEDGRQYSFNRSWTVQDQYFVDTNADGQGDTWLAAGSPGLPAVLPPWPAQKQVQVTVTWTDQQGQAESLTLGASMAPVTQSGSYQVANESANAKASPTVPYVPGMAPDVIAYDLGNNQKVETSKPVPEVKKQGSKTEVQFETVRYVELPGNVTKLEQEDFVTVECSCKMKGVGSGKTPHMTTLVGGELAVLPGTFINKSTGEPANNQQPTLCTQCCRDHHDTASMITDEQYFRKEAGGPHTHHLNLGNGNFSPVAQVGDTYDEVCRFKRVDGLFEIYPDWQLLDMVAFDDDHLFSQANLDDYTKYTVDLISKKVQGLAAPAKPGGRNITVPPGAFQIIARGIYLDPMKTSHLNEVIKRINANDVTWKAITPFYDVNLTLLANWSTANTTIAKVTQEPIQTIVDPNNNYYGTYSRGRLEAIIDGVTTLKVQSYPFNAGITGANALTAVEYTGAKSDTIQVTVDAKTGTQRYWGITGDVNCIMIVNGVNQACELNNNKKANYVDLSKMTIVPVPTQFTCLMNIPKGNATPFYSCKDVSENWTGTINFGFSMPGYTVTLKIQQPDKSVVTTNKISLPTGLKQTSNREYNIILELVK
ncbi:prepilin-type N-terminal cleavage/methylation domain-containing protein [Aliiglaciecola sp. CAU 1673]|uniref:prepilin-type N-terminal cleavage/methylation domain-containing protein n=1 Tax=Aliiglaciecola sp. CAU 1673 TaxID=3032595 RepID=UPI0023DB7394|nr:prepilin-type N-terminal cleavage/methylation domain-containing protein [Aliiglaciecola sp. CAU 1673]MDF2178216.1 prepilin-type N-terminal cleavage/methylation domain-containing protein [Aliiglaciecola sp. CAU 1673]